MKKGLMIGIIVAVLGLGAAGYFLFLKDDGKSKEVKEQNLSTLPVPNQSDGGDLYQGSWLAYTKENNYQITLPEILISASNGGYITKFALTINFNNENGLKIFKGEDPTKEKVAEEGKKKKEESFHQSPMEIKINSLVGTYMMALSEDKIKDKATIEKELPIYLNEKLEAGTDLIKSVLIQNYIVQ